jgi:hypothetical protein
MEQYFVVRFIVVIMITLTIIGITSAVEATENQDIMKKGSAFITIEPAVIATSDENVYVVWGSNDATGNNTEVMFRASS